MSTALSNFAHTGNPSQKGLQWEPYTKDTGACMIFDRKSEVRYFHDKDLFKYLPKSMF